MKPTSMLPENYLDLIFFNRNKSYGAYALRKNYPTTVLKSISFVVGIILVFAAFSFLHKSEPATTFHPRDIVTHLTNIQPNIVLPEKPMAQSPSIPKSSVTSTALHVVQNEVVTTKPIETATTTATVSNSESRISNSSSSSSTTSTINTTTNTETNNYTPKRWAEEMPKFQGDINLYLANHIQYPEMAKATNIQGKVVIEFVVSEDGSVSNLRLVKGIGGGCDDEAMQVVKNMPRWIPGKTKWKPCKDLHAVAHYF